MQNPKTLKLFKYIYDLAELVRMLGLRLQTGNNFIEFRNMLDQVPDRHPVNPAFNPDICTLDESKAFWVIGYNADNEVVHTQAIKLLEMEGSSLAEHLESHTSDYRSEGYDFALEETEIYLSPEASQISGTVTYHGEVWIKAGKGGYRSGSLVTLLTRWMMLKALLEWTPDYMIGLQAPITTCRGLGIREGYMRTEQRTLVWHLKNGEPPIEDWMVWMTRDEAEFNLRLPPQYFYNMFKKSSDPSLEALSA